MTNYELGYDRIFDDEPLPLRKPISQVHREEIESAIESGISVEALMNTYGARRIDAYFSDASAVFPGDQPPSQPGDIYNDAA